MCLDLREEKMLGLIWCLVFGIHSWQQYTRLEDDGKTTFLFLCPRCKKHVFFTVDFRGDRQKEDIDNA